MRCRRLFSGSRASDEVSEQQNRAKALPVVITAGGMPEYDRIGPYVLAEPI